MDKKLLGKIRDNVEETIRGIIGKGNVIPPPEIDNLHKLVKIYDVTDCMLENDFGEGYSAENDGNSSYRRGRNMVTGRYMSRDAMPLYHDARYYGDGTFAHHDVGNSARSYGDGNPNRYYDANNHNGYSGHSIHDRMIDQLERMMDEAKSENERQTIRDEINHLRR